MSESLTQINGPELAARRLLSLGATVAVVSLALAVRALVPGVEASD